MAASLDAAKAAVNSGGVVNRSGTRGSGISSGVTAVNSGGDTGELKTGYRGHRAITRYGIAVAVLAR